VISYTVEINVIVAASRGVYVAVVLVIWKLLH